MERSIGANIGSLAQREGALAAILFAIATALFAAQGFSSFISYEIFGLKENVVPIQVGVTVIAYGLLQIFEPRFQLLPIVTRHWALSSLAFGIFILTLLLARAADASAEELKAPFQFVVGISVFHLGYYFFSNPAHLRVVFSALFLTVGLSGLLALFELSTGISMPWARGDVVDRAVGEGAQGLEWFPVSYAYSVLLSLVLSGYYLFVPGAWYGRPSRLLCLWGVVFGSLGLLAASSRSGIVGLVLGLSVAYLANPIAGNRAKRRLAFVLLLGPLAALLVSSLLEFTGKNTDIGEDARLYATYAVYLPIVITNPMGVSESQLSQISTFFDAQQAVGLELPLETFLLGTAIAPHNGFMTAGIRYGWLGILFSAGLVIVAVRSARKTIALDSSLALPETHLQIALLGALAALVVHVCFHNMTVLTGDMRNWLPFGLILGGLNMQRTRVVVARMQHCAQVNRVNRGRSRELSSGERATL